jgi:hypothetical protein
MIPPSGRNRADVLRDLIEDLRIELRTAWTMPWRRLEARQTSLESALRELRELPEEVRNDGS